MIYYHVADSEGKSISRATFKKIFGCSYRKNENSGIRFEDAHCGIDPYDEDINGVINPLVCDSYDNYIEAHNTSCQEI